MDVTLALPEPLVVSSLNADQVPSMNGLSLWCALSSLNPELSEDDSPLKYMVWFLCCVSETWLVIDTHRAGILILG